MNLTTKQFKVLEFLAAGGDLSVLKIGAPVALKKKRPIVIGIKDETADEIDVPTKTFWCLRQMRMLNNEHIPSMYFDWFSISDIGQAVLQKACACGASLPGSGRVFLFEKEGKTVRVCGKCAKAMKEKKVLIQDQISQFTRIYNHVVDGEQGCFFCEVAFLDGDKIIDFGDGFPRHEECYLEERYQGKREKHEL